jgi:hypothetical protein
MKSKDAKCCFVKDCKNRGEPGEYDFYICDDCYERFEQKLKENARRLNLFSYRNETPPPKH